MSKKENQPAANSQANLVSRVYNLIILDESGSMEAIKKATIEGFNKLIQSIKASLEETPEIEQYVNFFSFNGSGISEHLPLIDVSHLQQLSEENYRPDNSTPLYDAIGYSVNRLRSNIESETGYSVLVTIFTDGEENSSREYSFDAVAALIKDLGTKGWVFTYIGANHDVQRTASSLNIKNHIKFDATMAETEAVMRKNISSRMNYMNKLKSGRTDLAEGFFDEDDKPDSK